jgi:cysteinyl-tRNA synthetase
VDVQQGIDPDVWQIVAEERQNIIDARSKLDMAPDKVLELVEQRQEARKNKRWNESDQLREEIAALGWSVMDTPQGPHLERS